MGVIREFVFCRNYYTLTPAQWTHLKIPILENGFWLWLIPDDHTISPRTTHTAATIQHCSTLSLAASLPIILAWVNEGGKFGKSLHNKSRWPPPHTHTPCPSLLLLSDWKMLSSFTSCVFNNVFLWSEVIEQQRKNSPHPAAALETRKPEAATWGKCVCVCEHWCLCILMKLDPQQM